MCNFLLIILIAVLPVHQDCNTQIPTINQWNGYSLNPNGKEVSNSMVSLTKIEPQKWEVSDISTGFFTSLGYSGDNKIVFELNCESEIVPSTTQTKFGDLKVLSGNWSEDDQQITISWSVPSSDLDFQTTLIYNK